MNVGLKIFPEVEEGYVDKFAGNIDFIEIFAAPGSNYYFVAKYELPVVIHASHSQFGVNYCNPDKIEINEKTLSWAKMLADRFNSSKIIIHPEFIENEKCTMEYLANLSQFLAYGIINPYEAITFLIARLNACGS